MGKYNAILLGFSLPEEEARRIFAIDAIPAVQTHKFAWSLSRALRGFLNDLFLISAAPIQSYPRGRKVLFGGGEFQEDGLSGVRLPFINFILIKHLTRFFSCFFLGSFFIFKKKARLLFVHGVHTPFLLFAFLARIFYGVKVVVVLTDPPGVISTSDGGVVGLFKRLDAFFVSYVLRKMSAVISLSPDLASRYAPGVPSLVFPGIANSIFLKNINSYSRVDGDNPIFTIVYAGGVCSAYGVDRLIDAVLSIVEAPVCLKVFGRGDQEDRVKALAKIDSRFFYGGFVGDNELVREFLGADLLINPRPSSLDVSIMSFPSKLIEYLLSGRPVLTTRIKGIPPGYRRLYNFIDDESSDGVKSAILSIISEASELREAKALAAKNFVIREISEDAIGERIGSFIELEVLDV